MDTRSFIKERVAVVLAAPPCTEFSASGARWWLEKDHFEPEKLRQAVDNVRSCLRFIKHFDPYIWAMENPKGRLPREVPEVGQWKEHFDPFHYAGYIEQSKFPAWRDDECQAKDAELVMESNRYTKDTYLWGNYNVPDRRPLAPVFIKGNNGKKYGPIHFAAKNDNRWKMRSETPSGFAEAFYWANKELQIKKPISLQK